MPDRRAELVLLCEDQRHEICVRRFLVKLGFEPRRIRVVPAPAGRGSAEQHVRLHYADEVAVLRRKRSQGRTGGLVVVVDGDTRGVAGRKRQLSRALAREPGEEIAILVPTWSIETWILDLLGEPVSEDQSCKHLVHDIDYKEVVNTAWQRWLQHRQGQDAECVPSLRDAAEELAHLPGVGSVTA